MIVASDGRLVGLSTDVLAGSPFETFLVPGLVLFLVLGVGSTLVAAGLLWTAVSGDTRSDGHSVKSDRAARPVRGSVVVSLALIAWVFVEGAVIGFGDRLQIPNLLQGVATLVVAVRVLWRR